MRDFDTFERFGRLLESQTWTFAKTMPKNPHHYVVRERGWRGTDDQFTRAVQYIRDHGYTKRFGGRPYVQINVNDHFYWTMGAPAAETTIINRKVRGDQSNDGHPLYDQVADEYDELYSDPGCVAQNEMLFDHLGDLTGLSVLDVGCGTGLLLDHPTVGAGGGTYLGIDPSGGMLAHLNRNHPTAVTLRTDLGAFVGGRYDLVVALFGVANYLDEPELRRIPTLLKPGGRFFVMFGVEGYRPRVNGCISQHDSYRPGWPAEWLSGDDEAFDDTYTIVTGGRP